MESPRHVGAEERLWRCAGPAPKSPIPLRSTIQAPLLHSRAHVELARFMIPAFIYFVNNNVVFFILKLVDPVTFQLLSQLKTIFTGLLFRLFLQRRLSAIQYTALITLACGTATAQIPSGDSNHGSALGGLLLSVLSAFLSSLGGIYSEKLLKDRPSASIHWQNMQLYAWGVLFNALGFAIKDGGSLANGWSTGYENSWAWAVVLCNACNGLAISAVLKFADNIARVYAHAIAMVATMLVSVRLFAAPITPQLVIAIALVGTSTLQYNLPKPALLGEWDAVDAKEEESKQLMGSPAMVRANEEEEADQHAGRPMLRLDGKR